jgi:hypothetical protein
MTLRRAASIVLLFVLICFRAPDARAFDYEGHRAINQLALETLPSDFPAFVRESAARERIAFLSGEPDRWRNISDLALRNATGPDHYIDLEELRAYGLSPETLPPLRYDFAAILARERLQHPDRVPAFDSDLDQDHTRGTPGYLPWAVVEYCGKLKSGFSYLKAYEAAGTPEEIGNARANIIYIMGVMGHFVGDAAQPLHTTIHHHGWVGPNPHGYTTDRGFHQWIDGEYFRRTGGIKARALFDQVHPAIHLGERARPETLFRAVVAYIVEQGRQVEPLYQLEKEGQLSAEGATGSLGRPFLDGQLVKAGQMLGNLWLTAWKDAPVDNFLKSRLAARQEAEAKKK